MERRHLSVVFCDLVGSSALSSQLDPEVMHGVLSAYHTTAADIIKRFDGYVAQYLGDGLLVYFSFPTAHEDDARRAVQASLDIIQAIAHLNAPLRTEFPGLGEHQLKVRLGIHTGEVVVGQLGHPDRHETIAVGEIPNIAARLQALAEPNTVLISASTYELVEGFFECTSRGETALKGFAEPIRTYHVVRPSGQRTRFAVAKASGLRRLIGREDVMQALREAWTETQTGRGRAILLRGEPGIGKSRLVQALKDELSRGHAPWFECQASSFAQHSAFQPAIDLLRTGFAIPPDARPEPTVARLRTQLLQYDSEHPTWLALFGVLLGVINIDSPEAESIAGFSALKLRTMTIDALKAWLSARAHECPMLVICEDMQWVDPSTLELFTQLMTVISTMPLLLLMTARTEFNPPLESALLSITLTGLPPEHLIALVQGVIGAQVLPEPLIRELVAKADGNPLFAEELAKMLVSDEHLAQSAAPDVSAEDLSARSIPARLQDLLTARLDSVGEAKSVAQLGSVIGRGFPRSMLAALSDLDTPQLDTSLTHLLNAELLYPVGHHNDEIYQFKHALIQEAAYTSLLVSKRRTYHAKIVALLERQSDPVSPEMLARHCEGGGLIEKAVDYWRTAGEHAVVRYANSEAISHLRRALTLLNDLEETPIRHRTELSIWLSAITVLHNSQGAGSPLVGEALERAQALQRYESDLAVRRNILIALTTFNVIGGRCDTARKFAQAAFSLATPNSPEQQRQVYFLLGLTGVFSGALTDGIEALNKSMSIPLGSLRPAVSSHVSLVDARAGAYAIMALALWIRGYPDQASIAGQQACNIAMEIKDPYAITFSLATSGYVHALRGDYLESLRLANQSLEYASDKGFGLYVGLCRMTKGWVLMKLGNLDEGSIEITEGLKRYRSTGARALASFAFSVYSDGLRDRISTEESFSAINEAFSIMEASYDFSMLAELYRVQGEFFASKAFNDVEAERCFQKAADVARNQKANSLSLRVAMSRGKLLVTQDRKDEAVKNLRAVLADFTEGFETQDLIEANKLLDQWSANLSTQEIFKF